MELPVLVLAEKGNPDRGQGVRLEQPETLVEGVVDVNAAAGTDNESTAGSISSQHLYTLTVYW